MIVVHNSDPSAIEVGHFIAKMDGFNRMVIDKGKENSPEENESLDNINLKLEIFTIVKEDTNKTHGGLMISKACKMTTVESFWLDKYGRFYWDTLGHKLVEDAKASGQIGIFAHVGEYSKVMIRGMVRFNFKHIGSTSPKAGKWQRHFYYLDLLDE